MTELQEKIKAEIQAEIVERIRKDRERDEEILEAARELSKIPETLCVSDFDYVWYYYDPKHGFYDFFKELGLTETEVKVAMRCAMNTTVFQGTFDTMTRELTRDILYYMKGIKMPKDDIFKGKYEYQYWIDELFGF